MQLCMQLWQSTHVSVYYVYVCVFVCVVLVVAVAPVYCVFI